MAREAFVEDGAEGELIGGRAGLADPEGLLGRHAYATEPARTMSLLVSGLVSSSPWSFERPKSTILEHDAIDLVLREEDVGGLEIAMDGPLPVRESERRDDRQEYRHRLRQREAAAVDDLSAQVVPVEISSMTSQVSPPCIASEVHDLEDVRVLQARGDPALAQEAGGHLIVPAHVLVLDLDGDALAEAGVPPLDDARSRPLPEETDDLVGSEPGSRRASSYATGEPMVE